MLRYAIPLSLAALTAAFPTTATAQGWGPGAVYTMTNQTAENEVAVGFRSPRGHVVPFANYATGGTGTGGGIGSQGALASSDDGRWLVVVNSGSDDVTLFRTFFNVLLWRRDVEPSRGTQPTSVAIHGNLVYVLNAGSDEVSGFRIRGNRLRYIASYPLSQAGAAAAQVGFDPAGRHVVVTERATDRILTYPVQRDGSLGSAVVNDSAGQTPFGFSFRGDGTLVVSEAAGGQPGASVVSTYAIGHGGVLSTITAAAATDQAAACWIAIPRNGRFAYTTNTADGSLTGFGLDPAGQLTRLDPSGRTGDLGMGARPIDFEFEPRGRVLFVLDSGNDEIVALRRAGDGSLSNIAGSWTLPDGAAGLITR